MSYLTDDTCMTHCGRDCTRRVGGSRSLSNDGNALALLLLTAPPATRDPVYGQDHDMQAGDTRLAAALGYYPARLLRWMARFGSVTCDADWHSKSAALQGWFTSCNSFDEFKLA